ncbi:MAG: hypothetical protein HQ567_20720 [Candidatus Nealsonbacteria bacterium]|nr:hypothetical protein [Candidatus Nealsonbacteria bacterium]
MKYAILLVIVSVLGIFSLQASEEDNYGLKVVELAEKGTAHGSPELVKYLKSLTKEQLLTALRQYSKVVEAQTPTEAEWAPVISMCIMVCYAEPLKRSDLSDEEFRKMRRGTKRRLEDGLVPARFTNETFEKVIAGIADRKEGTYFRYTLLDIFSTKEFFPVLSKPQKERFLDTCLTVLNDRKSPDMVRSKCIDVMSKRIFQREYSHIIHEDDVVKELQRTSEEELRNLVSLINSGEIKLTTKTIELLAPWRRRIQDLRKKLADLQEDEREPKSLKKEAKGQLYWLDRLPLINAKDPAPKPLKN